MSVLESPRLYFKGEVTWDPIVTNNDPSTYDEATAEPVFSAANNKVTAFRQQAIADAASGGNWNPHGTHRVKFYDCSVCGFDRGGGFERDDPVVSAGVQLTGMLVDLEPYGAFSSQIYFDRMTFGVDGGYFIHAPRKSRFTARYINFARNSFNQMIAGVGSVVWQTSFAKIDGLRIDPQDLGALESLNVALGGGDVLGLTVRFNAYRTIYYDNDTLRNNSEVARAAAAALASNLTAGGFQPNPARSLVVGVVGLWREGEPAHEPTERRLTPTANSPLAAAFARIHGNALTIDLSNCVPEVDANLSKHNLGQLKLVAVDSRGQVVADLGVLPYAEYDRASYEKSAGIVTLALSTSAASAATGNDIQLRDPTNKPLLTEAAAYAIPDVPNIYLDQGQATTAGFQAFERGAPAARQIAATVYTMSSDGGTVVNQKTVTTDLNGRFQIDVPTAAAGILSFSPSMSDANSPAAAGINPQINTYMYVRMLPTDPEIAALAPTWDNVFAKVLANWNAMAPCMDNWLELDDPQQVRSHGALLKRLTDPARFEDYRFMPVTRDMTTGERTLLYKFLDATELVAAVAKRVSYADMSHAMRAGVGLWRT